MRADSTAPQHARAMIVGIPSSSGKYTYSRDRRRPNRSKFDTPPSISAS